MVEGQFQADRRRAVRRSSPSGRPAGARSYLKNGRMTEGYGVIADERNE